MNSSQEPASVDSLKQGYDQLKFLFTVVLVILLVLTLSLDLFLFKQASVARKQVEENRSKVQAMVEDYQKNNAPLMGAFLNNLYAYAQSHPDFVPILKKYPLPVQNSVPQVPSQK